jgi:NAD(P)-dependent dehydrogenase (short-subunit alcohol dehydrogenase family)
MNFGLQNKVIIVTGGAKGIGEAITKGLAAEGAIPVVFGNNEVDNIKTIEKIKHEGGTAYQYKVELSNPAECKKAVENLIRDLGRIDGVVNNAGVNDSVSLENGSYEGFMSSLHKNLVHYYKTRIFYLHYRGICQVIGQAKHVCLCLSVGLVSWQIWCKYLCVFWQLSVFGRGCVKTPVNLI